MNNMNNKKNKTKMISKGAAPKRITVAKTSEKRTKNAEDPVKPIPEPRERYSILVKSSLLGRMRAAVYYTPGLTVAALAEAAFIAEISRIEKEKGFAFLPLNRKLKAGRPLA